MTVFVIDINTSYSNITLPIIKKLCDYNSVDLYVLNSNIEQNTKNLPASWLKCFCHDLVNDDFIICWDLDLIPIKMYDINKFFLKDRLNLAKDFLFRVKEGILFNEKFKYNCGLIGIPKSYKNWMHEVYASYDEGKNYPSWEQHYINDRIFDENILVNELPIELNYAKNILSQDQDFSNALNIHFTYSCTEEERATKREHIEKNIVDLQLGIA